MLKMVSYLNEIFYSYKLTCINPLFILLLLCIYEQLEHKISDWRIKQSAKLLLGMMGFYTML